MLIKSASDRTKDIELLQELLMHPAANADIKRKIEQEIRFIRSGVKGEREAAYEIEFHYGSSKNWVIIHDLRLDYGGRIAQIDHIMMNRFLDIWVCESKRFNEGIAVNEHGECSAFYGGKPYGVPSPFEQNRKHIAVLKDLFDHGAVELPTRLGFTIKPDIRSLILVSKNARISRPKGKVEGIEHILKADQVKARIDKDFDSDNNILVAAKIIASDTLQDLATRLAAVHKPIEIDWHAKFGLSKECKASSVVATIDAIAVAEEKVAPVQSIDEAKDTKNSKRVCTSCATPVPYHVAKFCWFNKAKFGGKIYCLTCQKNV